MYYKSQCQFDEEALDNKEIEILDRYKNLDKSDKIRQQQNQIYEQQIESLKYQNKRLDKECQKYFDLLADYNSKIEELKQYLKDRMEQLENQTNQQWGNMLILIPEIYEEILQKIESWDK